ncbi:MAG TPA: Mur ligase domain-containing protein, partial [Armatimonadota bacterium]|nr:Mur ligase domain-containing protein [Armatimonadota bacterium]
MVLEATQGRLAGGAAPDVFHGVSTDSRSVPRGALFVALKGEQFDGHDFVA